MADETGIANPAGNPPAGAGTNTPPPTGNGAPGGDKPVAGAGGEGKTYSFKEDRSDWVPRTRLNEVSGKLTKYEQDNLTLKQQLELSEKRTRALVGVEPSDPKAAEAEEIRTVLYGMFPQLKALEKLNVEQLEQVFEAAEAAQSTSRATWERHATGMLEDLESQAATALGSDKLTPTQQKHLRRAYREEAQAAADARQVDEQGRATDPTGNDFLSRHERGDKSLIKEFVKAFLDDWFEPARRSVTAASARRNMRPIPRGERTRLPVATGAAKVDLSDNNEFKKALIAARGGGQD